MQLISNDVPVPSGSFGISVTEMAMAVPRQLYELLVANGVIKADGVYHMLTRPGAVRVLERHFGWSSDERAAAVAELETVLPEELRVIPRYVARGGALLAQ